MADLTDLAAEARASKEAFAVAEPFIRRIQAEADKAVMNARDEREALRAVVAVQTAAELESQMLRAVKAYELEQKLQAQAQ